MKPPEMKIKKWAAHPLTTALRKGHPANKNALSLNILTVAFLFRKATTLGVIAVVKRSKGTDEEFETKNLDSH